MTPRLSLSPEEYATLAAFPEGGSVSSVDLAVAAQLTGTQIRRALHSLRERGLVDDASADSISLSSEGEGVRKRLSRQRIIIDLSDSATPRIHASDEEVDAALEKELSNLQA